MKNDNFYNFNKKYWKQKTIEMKRYLLETSIKNNIQKDYDNLNKNVVGAVLVYNTKVKELDYGEPGSFNRINLISILLFLDFRTGRVERFIINSSDPKLNTKKIDVGVDYKEDLYFTWNNERYKVFHEDEHSWGKLTDLSTLGNGKLTKHYFILFMAELVRDYLKYFNSYLNGNVASIRKLTSPIKPTVFEPLDNEKQDKQMDGVNNYKLESEGISDNKVFKKVKPGIGTGLINNMGAEQEICNKWI